MNARAGLAGQAACPEKDFKPYFLFLLPSFNESDVSDHSLIL
jgi:hypothetical protein